MNPEVQEWLREGDLARRSRDWQRAWSAYVRAATALETGAVLLQAVVVLQEAFGLSMLDPRVPERLAAIYGQLGLARDQRDWHEYAQALPQWRGKWPADMAVADLCDLRSSPDGTWEGLFHEGIPQGLARFRRLDAGRYLCHRPENFATVPDWLIATCLGRALSNDVLEAVEPETLVGFIDSRRVYLITSARVSSADPMHSRSLAEACLALGECRTALAFLQPLFRAEPRNVETLKVLERVFAAMDEPAKADGIRQELQRLIG